MEAPSPQVDRDRLAELAQAVLREPRSIPVRLDLAMALLAVDRRAEAIQLFRDIALTYAEDSQLVQAMAVCRGILEIDPGHEETLALLASFVERRSGRAPRFLDPGDTPADGTALPADDVGFDVSDEATIAGGPPVADDDDTMGGGDEQLDTPLELSTMEERAQPPEHDEDDEEHTNPGVDIVAEEAPADPVADALLRSAEHHVDDSTPIPSFPLFSDLPRAAFVELLRELRVLELGPNEIALAEGTVGDAFYLIAQGTVRVKKAGVELAVLGPGAFFGEFAVLADQRRHATVETMGPVRLLEVTRTLLDKLIADHAGVSRTLRAFYADRLLATLVHTAPFFSALNPEERADVAQRFRPRRFGRGATIIEEGSQGGGLYLILVGEVEVVRDDAADVVALGRLGEGGYFGEMSLLRGGTASASVRATRLCETVQLPPRDFYDIVSRHPVLWDQLRVEAHRRELTNVAILAGEARGDEAARVYLV